MMKQPLKAVKISNHVYWVGAVDWGIRDFHGYATNRGTTYNAYLILADKVTLIDTVKAPFKDEMLSRIASIVEPGNIDYIISNHAELDHSGCLPQVIEAVQPEKVFASEMGVKTLSEYFHFVSHEGIHPFKTETIDQNITPVKDGEKLSLGNMNVSFVKTAMLHWPDSMFTYLADEEVLFSQDAFGMHLASSEKFDDEIDEDVLECEAAKYYANILLPLSSLVTKLLERVGNFGIPFRIVAPDHGPIWREGINKILDWYAEWAAQKPTKKAVVVYDTMWQSTAAMARTICEGLVAGGASVKVMPLGSCHRSDVATEILDAGALLIGTPTINKTIFPTVADVLTYLKGLKPRNLIGAAFGSYGWSGEAVDEVTEALKAMKIDVVGEGIKVKYVPDTADLEKCFSLGVSVAEKLKDCYVTQSV